MASSTVSVRSSNSSKKSFVDSILAKILPVTRGQYSTKIIEDQRRRIAEARNNNAKEKRIKDKILALCTQSIETGATGIKSTKKVVLIRQLIESSDCSTDSHIFQRAVEHLEKYIGTAFSSIEDIENKCAGLLPATRRIVYELGGIPWVEFAIYLHVSKRRVTANEDVPFDEVVCAKILLRWIQGATETKTAIFLMQVVRDLNKKQIEDEMQLLEMTDADKGAISTDQLPVQDNNAHTSHEDTAERDLEGKLSEIERTNRQMLEQLQEIRDTYITTSPGNDPTDINPIPISNADSITSQRQSSSVRQSVASETRRTLQPSYQPLQNNYSRVHEVSPYTRQHEVSTPSDLFTVPNPGRTYHSPRYESGNIASSPERHMDRERRSVARQYVSRTSSLEQPTHHTEAHNIPMHHGHPSAAIEHQTRRKQVAGRSIATHSRPVNDAISSFESPTPPFDQSPRRHHQQNRLGNRQRTSDSDQFVSLHDGILNREQRSDIEQTESRVRQITRQFEQLDVQSQPSSPN